jgi:hypothetical protein
MTTKADIKRLLSKGFTGKEAGRLVFKDNWLADTGRGGFLSEKDVSSLKAGLKGDKDIKEYNSYIRLYKYVDYTLKELRIVALEAEVLLHITYRILDAYGMHEAFRLAEMYIPAIVTQKQYEELKAKQRALKLDQVSSLQELISYLSEVDFEIIVDDDEPEPESESEIDFQNDERLREAVSTIQELLRAGKLHPLKLKKREDYYDGHKLKIPAQPVQEVIEMLDKFLTGELQYGEDDSLRMTVFRGKNLYELEELEGFIKSWIEEYTPNWDEETSARPLGRMQSQHVAIIQNPQPSNLDERGYWIEPDYLGLDVEMDTKRDSESLTIFMNTIRERIKGFLAVKSVLEAISKVIELDFLEDLKQWEEELHVIVKVINAEIGRLDGKWEKLGLPELKPIKIGKMKASPATLRYFRERMAMALGDNWWEAPGENLQLEADEPDTLAQEFTEELEEVMEKELAKRGRMDG